ncbi:ATP-binding protein [Kocuria dechangensis]|nr:ATP-binding protein [Kocuria dechangensis]
MTATASRRRHRPGLAAHDSHHELTWAGVLACVRAKVPVMLWGAPGIGKSSQIEGLAAQVPFVDHVESTSVANRENVDFNGVMSINEDGIATYSAFDWVRGLQEAKSPLWFIDEVTTGAEDVQKALLRPIQERYIGSSKISEDVAIVLAGNDPADAADGTYLAPPLANRVGHFEVKLDRTGWLQGLADGFSAPALPAAVADFHPDPEVNYKRAAYFVTGYLYGNQHFINPDRPTDPEKASKAWASGRSWHNLTKVLSQLELVPENVTLITAISKAFVGDQIGAAFGGYITAAMVYDVHEVLTGAQQVSWREESDSVLFALISSVAAFGLDGSVEGWEQAEEVMIEAAANGRGDLAVVGIRKLYNNMPSGARIHDDSPQYFVDTSTGIVLK